MDTISISRLHVRHAIKTGLACSISYLVSILLDSHYPVWAVISTIVVMQRTSVAESLQASLLRFSGMALGAVVGVVLSLIFIHPENIWWISVILFGLNAAGAYFFQYGSRYMLASIAATIVLLVGHFQMGFTTNEAVDFGLTLIWEIALGVGTAVVVSTLLWPVRLTDTVRKDLENQYRLVAEQLRRIAAAYRDNRAILPDELRGLIAMLLRNPERLSAASQNEKYFYRENYDDLDLRIVTINRSVTVLRILLDVLDDGAPEKEAPLFPERAERIAALFATALEQCGHAEGWDDASFQDNIRQGIDLSRQTMESLSTGTTGTTSLHGLMRAHSFFRLLTQLGELYRPGAVQALRDGMGKPAGVGA